MFKASCRPNSVQGVEPPYLQVLVLTTLLWSNVFFCLAAVHFLQQVVSHKSRSKTLTPKGSVKYIQPPAEKQARNPDLYLTLFLVVTRNPTDTHWLYYCQILTIYMNFIWINILVHLFGLVYLFDCLFHRNCSWIWIVMSVWIRGPGLLAAPGEVAYHIPIILLLSILGWFYCNSHKDRA